MPSVILTEDYPGNPKGTVLTLIGRRYRNVGTGIWFEESVVDGDPDTFRVPIADNATFHTANADGTVTQVTATDDNDVKANWFRSSARAQVVALRILQYVRDIRRVG